MPRELLSEQDRIRVRLPGEDLGALHRAVDATTSHLDEARGSEERVPFAEHLVRLREQGHDGELTRGARGLLRAAPGGRGLLDRVSAPGASGPGPPTEPRSATQVLAALPRDLRGIG